MLGLALILLGIVGLVWVFLHKRKTNSAPKNNLNLNVDLTEAKAFDSDEVLGLKKKSPTVKATVSLHEVKREVVATREPEPDEGDQPEPPQKDTPIVVLYVIAKHHAFAGYELLQSLLSAGLRFGKMKIFHRHENKNGYGKVLFSLASASAPGTFDIPKIGGYECPGLSMFLQCDKDIDNLAAFDLMLDTAKQLADELGGELLDDHRQPMSMDKAADYRRTIRQYESSLHTRDLFEQA